MSVPEMRDRSKLRVLTLATLVGVAAAVASGQEPKPVELTPETFAGGNGIELARAWRFHPGDDTRWADPTLDDSAWELANPRMPPGKLPQGGWPGIGWFRRHLRVDPALWGKPLALTLLEAGAAEVYLDGEVLYRYGTIGTAGVAEVAYEGRDPRVVVFPPQPDHVLVVRYSCAAAGRLTRSGLDTGFVLALGSANAAIAQHAAGVRRSSLLQATFTGVAVFLALLHLAFYFFYPKMRENLFYAFCMAAFAVIVFCEFESAHTTSSAALLPLRRFGTSAVFAAILFGLLAYYAVRTRPWPRTWKPLAATGALLIGASLFQPLLFGSWAWYLYFAAMIGEIVRVEWSHRTIEREESGMMLVGFLVLGAAIALQVLVNVGAIAPIAGMRNVYLIGLLGMAVTQSLSFARTLARTSLHLERRLAQVQTLSGQLLEQERAAHARELQTRLLEAENARKGKELEEGRALQLSMLPFSVPQLEGLDIAAAMTTASEVGGDYYDFHSSANGSLVIAVGDATGHGVAAGIMVTAVKAVLATVGGEPSLATMLSECDRVLRGMNVRPLHMCLTVARVTPGSVAFCSAAMPPMLICRAANGAVEELGVGGLPLGGRLSPSRQEQNAPLAPGDTLLFATDGFHELLDPADNALGFEGAKRALQRAAGASANEVVARLTADVSEWRGDREQDDDITFVVVRVK